MNLINADLHCHSVVSDGTLSPEALAERARLNGVELWSLTDHDEIDGQQRAASAARALGLDYLSGCEISVSFAGITVHIVGLGFDAQDERLRQGLAATRGGRGERAHEMSDALARAGVKGAYEGALHHAGNPELISRTHFARHPGRHRRVRRPQRGLPAFPHRGQARLRAAPLGVAGRRGALDHPGRRPGGDCAPGALQVHAHRGVRACSPSSSPTADAASRSSPAATPPPSTSKYADVALEFGLLASRGSDFHSPGESRTDLGCLPDLPGQLTPVWTQLQHRVQRA